MVVAAAPGRVNLIGDHTDYTGGMVLPMAIDRWTIIDAAVGGDVIDLVSADEPDPLHLDLPVAHPHEIRPDWGRYVAGVAAEMSAVEGFSGTVSTSIPIGSGLSSSAALEVATALALGFTGSRTDLALTCQRAEQRASGVPCGIMDQLTIASAMEAHALEIDCSALTVEPVPLPHDVSVVVRFVAPRQLAGSEYADRVSQCHAVETVIGPLRGAVEDDLAAIADPVLRSRGRHVIRENERVRRAADALRDGRPDVAGRLMTESHHSLSVDFATSTPVMDAAVHDMLDRDGVFGARMTGGGFGGCIVALVDGRRALAVASESGGWIVRAAGPASVR